VDWYFTRENPHGLPELEKRIDGRGNITYDDSAVLNFFLNYVDNEILPRIEAANRKRLGELPTEEPITEEDDPTAWMEQEHARQVASVRAEYESSGNQSSDMNPYQRPPRSIATFSDGTPIPNPDDLPF